MNDYRWVALGLFVDDAIEQSFYELVRSPGVYVPKKKSKGFSWLRRKIFGLLHRLDFLPEAFSECLTTKFLESDLYDLILKPGARPNFLFIESPESLNKQYMDEVRSRFPDSIFFLMLVNSLKEYSGLGERVDNVQNVFDFVVTCNSADARAKGWKYHPDCYSPSETVDSNDGPFPVDVLFLASDKGRRKKAEKLYDYLTSLGLRCDFSIVNKNKKKLTKGSFSILPKPISYDNYLRKVSTCKCILEIVASGESYSTLRTMEAYAYGKLLMTDNQYIVNEPYYDENRVIIFSDISKINLEKILLFKGLKKNANPFLPSKMLSDFESYISHEN